MAGGSEHIPLSARLNPVTLKSWDLAGHYFPVPMEIAPLITRLRLNSAARACTDGSFLRLGSEAPALGRGCWMVVA